MYKVASVSGKNVIATAGIPQAKKPPLSLYETGRQHTFSDTDCNNDCVRFFSELYFSWNNAFVVFGIEQSEIIGTVPRPTQSKT